MFRDLFVWRDGKFVKWSEANVHLMSHSFGRGSAIFEVISCYPTDKGTAVFRLPDHLRRLKNSAARICMKLPFSQKHLKEAVIKTVAKNNVGFGIIKLMCFYSSVEFEIIPSDKRASVAIVAVDLDRDLKLGKLCGDICTSAAISRWRKYHPQTVPVDCKAAANYLGPMLAKLDVKGRGYDAPILLDINGFLAEGATEAFFFVKDEKLYTSRLGNILPSITRASVMEISKDLGLPLFQGKFRPQKVLSADEAFFSSTLVKVWPVRKLEGRKLPAPGPISKKLIESFESICKGSWRKYKKWLTHVC